MINYQIKYFRFYQTITELLFDSKEEDNELYKVISYNTFIKNYLTNKLNNFTNNEKFIKNINNNILYKLSTKSDSTLLSKYSSSLKGGNLNNIGNNFLEVLHIFDKKHDFYKLEDISNDSRLEILKEANSFINKLKIDREILEDLYKNNDDFEEDVLVYGITGLLNSSFLTDINVDTNIINFIELKNNNANILNIDNPTAKILPSLTEDALYDKLDNYIKQNLYIKFIQ